MQSIFERMVGTYHPEGDCLIPNLALPGRGNQPIGKYGRMCRRYLQEYHLGLYSHLVTSGKLFDHLRRSTRPATSAWNASDPLWRSGRA